MAKGTVVVVGGTSEIGKRLAKHYAALGGKGRSRADVSSEQRGRAWSSTRYSSWVAATTAVPAVTRSRRMPSRMWPFSQLRSPPSERIQRRIDALLDEADEAIAFSDWPRVRDRAEVAACA